MEYNELKTVVVSHSAPCFHNIHIFQRNKDNDFITSFFIRDRVSLVRAKEQFEFEEEERYHLVEIFTSPTCKGGQYVIIMDQFTDDPL